jgi:hypothetical protein
MASDYPAIIDDAKIAELRAEIIGTRQPIPVIAQINDETNRAVYDAIERYNISFIKVGRDRYIDPLEYAEKRAACRKKRESMGTAPMPPPRPVGRPRKAAGT